MQFVTDAGDVEEVAQLLDFKGGRVDHHHEKAFVGCYREYIFFSSALEIKHMSLFYKISMCLQDKSGIFDLHKLDIQNVNQPFLLSNQEMQVVKSSDAGDTLREFGFPHKLGVQKVFIRD